MNNRVKKITIIVGATLLILFFILLIRYFLQDSSLPRTTTSDIPVPTSNQQQNFSSKDLVMTSIEPPEDSTGERYYGRIQQITLTFNKPVSPQSFKASVTPIVPLLIVEGSTAYQIRLYPQPLESWIPETVHTITIEEGKAVDGSTLQSPIIYRIKTTIDPGVPQT
jgi:hypothetical protein